MLGPIQLLAVQFDDVDHFTGEIMRSLRDLRHRGLIRVIDILFVAKDRDNELTTFTHSDLDDAELVEFGSILGAMLGLNEPGEPADPSSLVAALEMAKANFGLNYGDVHDLADKIKPGQAAGILLFENVWATDFRDAVRNSGGRIVKQGYLTPDAMTMVGAELQAVVDAQLTIEAADALAGAAVLDALLTIEAAEIIEEEAMVEAAEVVLISEEIQEEAMAEAAAAIVIGEEIKTAVAADVLRTLVAAGYIEEMAIQHALDTLTIAGFIEEEALQEAVMVANQ